MEEDAGAVGCVAQQREDEEEQGEALARALFLVLDDLRNARPEVADGADVPQDGCAERSLELLPRAVVLGRGSPYTRLPCDGPPRCADGNYAENAQRVLDPGVLIRFLDDQAGQAAGPSASCAGIPAAAPAGMAPRQTHVGAVSATEQRLLDAVLTPGGLLPALAGVLDVVVDALCDEDQIGEAEVDGEGDDGGHELGPERADEVGDVAYEPDGEEGQRDAVCGGLAVVFDELGDLDLGRQRCDSRACVGRRSRARVVDVYACSRQASCILGTAIGGVSTHQQEDPRCKRDAAEDTRQRLVGGQVGAVADDGHVHCFWLQEGFREGGEWGSSLKWESGQSSSKLSARLPEVERRKKLETVLDSFSAGMTQRAPDGALGLWGWIGE